MTSIALIIPTFNNESTLRACLESIKKQSLAPNEIIIADGYSTDNSINIAKEFDCKIVYENRGTRAAACNEALKVAQGDLIAFTDSDVIADNGWLENIVETFKKIDTEIACVAGPHLEYPDESLFGKAVSAIYNTIFGGRWSEQAKSIFDDQERFVQSAAGCNAVYRREALEEVLPFNESLLTAEDADINFRLIQKGKKIFFTPNAIVYHQRPQKHKSFRNKSRKYAIGKIQFFRTHKAGLELWHLIPLLYFLTGLFISIALFVNLWSWVGLVAYFGIYLVTIKIVSVIQSIRYKQWQFLFMLPIMFIEGHLYWSIGILQEIFSTKKKRD